MSKKVEWVGGPHDGSYVDVPDEAQEIKVMVKLPTDWITVKEYPDSYVATNEVAVPIETEVSNFPVDHSVRHFVRWPKELS